MEAVLAAMDAAVSHTQVSVSALSLSLIFAFLLCKRDRKFSQDP